MHCTWSPSCYPNPVPWHTGRRQACLLCRAPEPCLPARLPSAPPPACLAPDADSLAGSIGGPVSTVALLPQRLFGLGHPGLLPAPAPGSALPNPGPLEGHRRRLLPQPGAPAMGRPWECRGQRWAGASALGGTGSAGRGPGLASLRYLWCATLPVAISSSVAQMLIMLRWPDSSGRLRHITRPCRRSCVTQ